MTLHKINQLEESMMNELNTMAYGLKGENVVYIDDVQRGLECEAKCLSCGGALIAKKGDVKVHHFAHHNGDGENCNESVLHRLSKQIIEWECMVSVPHFEINVEAYDISEQLHKKSYIEESRVLNVDSVSLELASAGFIPDVTCNSLGKKLYIEIVVSNDVSDEKLEKVKLDGTPMLVIDMSDYSAMDTLDTLKQGVIYDAPRYWAYHPEHQAIQIKLENDLRFDVSILDEKIILAVSNKLGLVPKSELLKPKSESEHIVLGYNSAYGYSKKNNRDFDFSTLLIARPIQSTGSSNYTIRSCGGYELNQIAFSKSLIPELEKLRFPCLLELNVTGSFLGGRIQNMVTDFKAV